jgi:peptide-methionine (S)-S-oxide reductase
MDKKKINALSLAIALVLTGAGTGCSQSTNTNQTSMDSNQTSRPTGPTEFATFGGGCFWCMEAEFQKVPGVVHITSGFAGGHTENPTYKQVCTGETGHAEVTQIEFDPQKVSYEKLLNYFWDAHDPTTLNRQGADTGTQYRSIILYSSDAQKAAAEKSKAEAQSRFKSPIVTEIVPLKKFYAAEDYHQNYYNDNPNEGYSMFTIKPKVEKFEKMLKAEKNK